MRTPSFSINPVGKESGIVFAGIPLGHEFSSFYWLCYKLVDGHRKSVNL